MALNQLNINLPNVLQCNLTDEHNIRDLTLQINQLSDKAEDLENALIVLTLSSQTKTLQSMNIQLINHWERAVRRLERLPSIVLSIATHQLTAWKLDLFLASDYRLAASDLTIYLARLHQQVWPGMSLYRLVQQVGIGPVRQLLLGKHLNAIEAQALYLIDEVYEVLQEQTLLEKITTLKHQSNYEFKIRRQLMTEAGSNTFEEALGLHLAACDREIRQLQLEENSNAR